MKLFAKGGVREERVVMCVQAQVARNHTVEPKLKLNWALENR
jgi:hypothetical protein